VNPAIVITHRLGLHEAEKAFKLFKRKQEGCIRVIFVPHRHTADGAGAA